MMNLNYQMVLILFQIFKTTLNISLKSTKHQQQFLLFMFTSIELIIVFKIKDGYKLELQTSEIMKLFGNTKKVNR